MRETASATDSYIFSKLNGLKMEDFRLYEITAHLAELRKNAPKARATLGRLTYEALGGMDWHEIIPILGFIELSTISTYVLDDIIDSQPERDAAEATWKKHGINKAIIAGCLQQFISMRMLDDLHADGKTKLEILKIGNLMWEVLWKGEGKNEWMVAETRMERYLERCYELAGIMFEAVSDMVAVYLGILEDKRRLVNEMGKQYGVGIMVRNDITAFFPEKVMRRKSKALSRRSFEDARKGLETYPIIHALANATPEEAKKIKALLGRSDATENELIELTRLLIRTGSIDATFDLISTFGARARTSAEHLPESEAREKLFTLFALLENTRAYAEEFLNSDAELP
jgi:geranylgeranyl pyrophosphate synthase